MKSIKNTEENHYMSSLSWSRFQIDIDKIKVRDTGLNFFSFFHIKKKCLQKNTIILIK